MKKIDEFIAPDGCIEVNTADWGNRFCKIFEVEKGRWEVYVDDVKNIKQIVLKARFQEPSSTQDVGSSYFKGGKL
jgi:hypothetical protein